MAFRVGILAVIGGILISIMIGVYAFDQAKTASKRLEEILESVAPKAGNSSHKKDLAYDQFIQVEILNRALAQTLERADISRLHRKKGKA